MGIKRLIDTGLWNKPIVLDEFNKTDKYFWLYCLSNSHNTLCGTALISPKTIAREMGIEDETEIIELINKFSTKYKMINYSFINNELLILNWHKYNWTKSEKLKHSLIKQADNIKTLEFKNYIIDLIENME